MSEPRITELAETDLDEAWEYLAERNESAADRLLDSILQQARLHAQFSLKGRPRDDLMPGLRSFVVSPYVVFFRSSMIRSKCSAFCMVLGTSMPS